MNGRKTVEPNDMTLIDTLIIFGPTIFAGLWLIAKRTVFAKRQNPGMRRARKNTRTLRRDATERPWSFE